MGLPFSEGRFSVNKDNSITQKHPCSWPGFHHLLFLMLSYVFHMDKSLFVNYVEDADTDAGQLRHIQPALGIQVQIIGRYQIVRFAAAIPKFM